MFIRIGKLSTCTNKIAQGVCTCTCLPASHALEALTIARRPLDLGPNLFLCSYRSCARMTLSSFVNFLSVKSGYAAETKPGNQIELRLAKLCFIVFEITILSLTTRKFFMIYSATCSSCQASIHAGNTCAGRGMCTTAGRGEKQDMTSLNGSQGCFLFSWKRRSFRILRSSLWNMRSLNSGKRETTNPATTVR